MSNSIMPSAAPVHQRRVRPSRPLRLLHTSDVHLESDTFGHGEQGRKLRDSIRDAFGRVISTANRLQADLLLIVGDLFDSSRITDEAFSFALSQIARARMPVIMTPGNHDAHDDRSLWIKQPPSEMPSNLHMLLDAQGSTLDFPELQAHVWGRGLVEHTPDYRPMAGIVPPVEGMWNIGLAHGFFMEEGEFDRSSPINPIDIESSAYDYIALGHIHVFTDCSRGATRAAYCGTPAPLYQEAGTVAFVRFDPEQGVEVERLGLVE